MVKVTFRFESGQAAQAIEAPTGASLMSAAKAAKVAGIEAVCGGSMVCGTCHVYVEPDDLARLAPPSADEAEVVAYGVDPRPGSRLSCQITVTEACDGLTVTVPLAQT